MTDLSLDRSVRRKAWQDSPEGLAAAAERAHQAATALWRSQQQLIQALDLPGKDVALLRGGALTATPAIAALRDGPTTISILSGPPGVGKTTAATWWLWSYVRDRSNWDEWAQFTPKLPIFTTAARLARSSRYEDGEMDKLFAASRLVVDDLGAEFSDSKGFFVSMLDEIINERYCAGRRTLVTTNCLLEVFRARYGERLIDRVREAGQFVGLGGPSLRRRP